MTLKVRVISTKQISKALARQNKGLTYSTNSVVHGVLAEPIDVEFFKRFIKEELIYDVKKMAEKFKVDKTVFKYNNAAILGEELETIRGEDNKVVEYKYHYIAWGNNILEVQ